MHRWLIHSLLELQLSAGSLGVLLYMFKAGYLSLALALELCLLLLSDFLVNLGSLAGLVAVCASGQGGIFLAALLVEGHILTLLLALLLALELVLDGALVLCLLLAL
jgi:hypothetical protein